MSDSTSKDSDLPDPDLQDADDVEGHLRMTDDQLASGATPAEVLAQAAEQTEERY